MKGILSIGMGCVALGLGAITAQGWDVYQANMPDVEKIAGTPTCWLAASSNQLAAAGWNLGDEQGIYNYLTDASRFGTNNSGWCGVATSWYLTNVARNPKGNPNGWNQNQYFNLTIHNSPNVSGLQGPRADDWPAAGASWSDYGALLTELNKTQFRYVNVGLRPDLNTGGHCMTLVGGDYYSNGTPRGQAVFHDNEGDLSAPPPDGNADDDAYDNSGTPTWTTSYNTDWECYYATVLGPGGIPLPGVPGYQGTWYPGLTSSGQFYRDWEVYDEGYSYASPSWTSEESVTVFSGSSLAPRDVYLLIDYTASQAVDPLIAVVDSNGVPAQLMGIEWAGERDYARYHFQFGWDPLLARILFPSRDYYSLENSVINWQFTDMPEPATLALLALGSLGLLCRRSRPIKGKGGDSR